MKKIEKSITCFSVTTDLVRRFEAELPTLRFRPPIQKSGAYRELLFNIYSATVAVGMSFDV